MECGVLRKGRLRNQGRASTVMHRPLPFAVIAPDHPPVALHYGVRQKKVQA
jgi:hypothetical protein